MSGKVQHLIIGPDDSEEKLVFVAKVSGLEKKPRLAYFLTSMAKTFPKLKGKKVNLTDEVIYTANLNVTNLSSNYKVHQAFFNKDYGLFVRAAGDKRPSSNSYLLYLPRTQLFTGKDLNQSCFKLQDLIIMQNPSFYKDLTILTRSETTQYLVLVKDLIKAAEVADALKHKNSYVMKESVEESYPGQVDARINLALDYSALLNLSPEVFERPQVTHYKKQEDAGFFQVIEKFEMRNLNPYVLLMEDKSTLNIY